LSPPLPLPPAKNSKGLIIGLTVGALVIVGGGFGAYLAFHKSPAPVPVSQSASTPAVTAAPTSAPTADPTTATATTPPATPAINGATLNLTLPSFADGFDLLADSASQSKVQSVQEELSAPFTSAIVGVYGSADSTAEPVFIDQALSASSPVLLGTPAESVSGALVGDTDIHTEPTSAANGALSCATVGSGSSAHISCVWEDEVTLGFLTFGTQMSYSQGAALADALRAAAET
jgi:hypothetical protein